MMSRKSIESAVASQQRLVGKVAIITGGASGIGASIVQLFHENGAKVVLADIQDEPGQAIASMLGENVRYIHCDVENEDEISNLVDTTISKHGKLDVMCNNVGTMDGTFCSILDSTKSELDRLVSVHMVGAFLGVKHAARFMVPQGKGCILFTTPSSCSVTGGISNHGHAMTTQAIIGLTKNLAAELGQHGIRVNCVSPFGVLEGAAAVGSEAAEVAAAEAVMGAITVLQGGVLRAEDVAKTALYLASDEANYVSGLNLVVDGRYSVANATISKALKLNH